MARITCLLLLTLTTLAPSVLAQIRPQTPPLLLTAHSISLNNGAASNGLGRQTSLPAPAFEHLANAFAAWHRYSLQPASSADLLASASLTTAPDRRFHLRLVNRSTGFTVWKQSVILKTSGDSERNLEGSINFVMLQLKSAVDHPPAGPHLDVP